MATDDFVRRLVEAGTMTLGDMVAPTRTAAMSPLALEAQEQEDDAVRPTAPWAPTSDVLPPPRPPRSVPRSVPSSPAGTDGPSVAPPRPASEPSWPLARPSAAPGPSPSSEVDEVVPADAPSPRAERRPAAAATGQQKQEALDDGQAGDPWVPARPHHARTVAGPDTAREPAQHSSPLLRDAGIRSVTTSGTPRGSRPGDDDPRGRAVSLGDASGRSAGASTEDEQLHAGDASSASPAVSATPSDLADDDLLAESWRDLGRRLLASHPPLPPSQPVDPPSPASSAAAGVDGERSPTLLIEQLEVRVVAAPPARETGAHDRPAPAASPRPSWDVAVRRYLGRA